MTERQVFFKFPKILMDFLNDSVKQLRDFIDFSKLKISVDFTGDPRYSLIFWGKRNPQILKSAEIGDCFSTKTVKWGKNVFKVHFLRFLPPRLVNLVHKPQIREYCEEILSPSGPVGTLITLLRNTIYSNYQPTPSLCNLCFDDLRDDASLNSQKIHKDF